jgi:hypothetical protein
MSALEALGYTAMGIAVVVMVARSLRRASRRIDRILEEELDDEDGQPGPGG